MIGVIRSVLFLCIYPDCCCYVSVQRLETWLYIHFGVSYPSGQPPCLTAFLTITLPFPVFLFLSLTPPHTRTRSHTHTPTVFVNALCKVYYVNGCESVTGWVRGTQNTREPHVHFHYSHNVISCAPPMDTNVCHRLESTWTSFLLNHCLVSPAA